MKVPFLKLHRSENDSAAIQEALQSGSLAGGGVFYELAKELLSSKFGFKDLILTQSCTSALEFSAELLDIKPGDEVIVPSYAYVSTAGAFANKGARLRFADSTSEHPNIDPDSVADLISDQTKAIVALHYGGDSCEMDKLTSLAREQNIALIEDAAHCIGSKWRDSYLGSIGDLGALSFQETKNVSSGEGGALMINDPDLIQRSRVYSEKGTNRSDFLEGKIDRYDWVGRGTSVKPGELICAALWSQLTEVDLINSKRKSICQTYSDELSGLESSGRITIPMSYTESTGNGHIFSIVLNSLAERDQLINYLSSNGIQAFFHYGALHNSPFSKKEFNEGNDLKNAERFAIGLIRLPVYSSLTEQELEYVIEKVKLGIPSG